MLYQRIAAAVFLVICSITSPFAWAGEKAVVIGRMFSPIGAILVGAGAKNAWTFPQLFDDIYAGRLLLALPGARGMVEVKEGDVHLILTGNLPELSPSPVLETAAILHENNDFDLDITLQRGRIVVENHRKDGTVTVRLRVKKAELKITPAKNGAFAVETSGRPVTPAFAKDTASGDHSVALLVVKGKAKVAAHGKQYALEGPVVLRWSGEGEPRGSRALNELPAWIDPAADPSPKTTAWHKAVEGLRRDLADTKSLSVALTNGLKHRDPNRRTVALLSYAAIGELEPVLGGLSGSADVRRAAIVALLHQLGRGADAEMRLRTILAKQGFLANEAELIIHLLHGPHAKELGQPETYTALIKDLQHEKVAVRELTAWTLYHLVPQGKGISYDADGSEEERARAQAAWRRLIPPGQVPPRPKL
jgi:hypothetical protein